MPKKKPLLHPAYYDFIHICAKFVTKKLVLVVPIFLYKENPRKFQLVNKTYYRSVMTHIEQVSIINRTGWIFVHEKISQVFHDDVCVIISLHEPVEGV